MCGICGLLDSGPQWSDALQQSLPRRQQRQQQLAVLNHALAPFRLKLSDFHGHWMLASPTGQQSIINNIDQIWKEAEAMLKRTIDPLDDDYLSSLVDKV
ncbi:hypothetical protein CWC46_01940 [Prodigiosinella confusarubida]|uniref:Uncharacterized protein n=1 Tax=Serratia sp. (strain ATCC 39006) TaxID=104623 RepID=A0A2I5TEN7_SERS3|nr:hypothetical protein [Serratia sp. ATCC 39006]AUG98694.1 hypothetical protein CWC46_01940 [Serratia sp. ATCC 39006]AUH03009.1 hypothetical protein Ser39006_001940 [Serratia sp. ATCC 39006]